MCYDFTALDIGVIGAKVPEFQLTLVAARIRPLCDRAPVGVGDDFRTKNSGFSAPTLFLDWSIGSRKTFSRICLVL